MARKSIGFFAIHRQQASSALKDMFRHPLGNFLTLAVLAVALTLPCTFYLMAKNITAVADAWQNPSQITLYLKHNTSNDDGQALADEIKNWSQVNSVKFITADQGLEQFRQNGGFDKALNLFDEQNNPLPAVVIVEPKSDWQTTAKANELAQKLGQQKHVAEVRLDRDWLQRLAAIQQLAIALALLMSGLMLFAVFLIVGNTLRLQVLSHKDEIQVMKMVGATNSYILRPYLYVGVWYGLIAALIAWGLTQGVVLLLGDAVAQLSNLYGSHFRMLGLNWDESVIMIMIATFLGLMAARLAAGRHLREINPV
ncbi:permease-like cell division protein FtsX [Photobacterium carnosum]|jgi:cell division transport system permease protein|uniref:Cell division protein FtsX n=1 Tax=Photobacterium carnosum TaxID=2023717 RepID=A0A2N4UUN8_9GAMM|nr:permease-like cell division protein FtsX [Photobacterium carnosum]MBY3788239.1 cell division protein FtsX [Photobacterium carnosum]MCD9494605.1 cell division protein FtsX [Photobacterium carnosum]MCD9522172.1 cell division protein FtsX [Photobacterium carnosum]MCD9526270.1 cell division protein FtsX [Photobacterium carnosum]MCD9529265.1 cell division protein FtsX [Photobacterium carnosum]